MFLRRILGALVLLIFAIVPAAAWGASLQPIGSFDQPIYVTSDPASGERLLVVEREGEIIQVVGGVQTVLADLRPAVGCGGSCSGERGLLSIAPAPNFDSSGRLYVDYANSQDGVIHVAEVLLGASASSFTMRSILSIAHPGASNHNGGQLQFGPDGFLYISTGDGGGANDEHHNAQNLDSLLGKILRIDPRPSGALPYRVPPGNPFPAAAPPADTIWSYGLRNPFRFSFDPGNGSMVIGDVGQAAREEIDVSPGNGAGANYGWNCREGAVAGPADDPGCAEASLGAFVEPAFDYPHTALEGGGIKRCAIIGGYVVRDGGLPELAGRYLYGDLCSGEIRSLNLGAPGATDRSESLAVPQLNSFGEDACGRVYAVSGAGQVFRLAESQPSVCPLGASFIRISATSRRVRPGHRAVITAFLSPCPVTRRGARISLTLGRRTIQVRRLDRACSARFNPKIRRRSNFRARIAPDGISAASSSRRLTIRPLRHRHRHLR